MSDSAKSNGSSLGLIIEKWAPFFLALICVALLYYWRAIVVAHFASERLSLENLYVAIFDWSAIQTGFLFAVYGFIIGKSDGFVKEAKSSQPMKSYIGYTTRATVIGFLLTIVSLVLIVLNPNPPVAGSAVIIILLGWFGLFIWAFLSFLRVAYIFGLIVRIEDKEVIPG